MRTDHATYPDGSVTCEGFAAYDDSTDAARPCVLVAHSWAGPSDAERETAARLAGRGYVGFAVDIYGQGTRGGLWDDNTALMQPYLDDRALLRRRLHAALDAARAHPRVDPTRIGAMGFCFGGLCVLDLARSAPPGSGVRGVVSVHGLFTPPGLGPQPPITARVLALHGWDDPMAPPHDVLAFVAEMSAAGADWQVHAYGNTMHAFTAPGASMPERGLLYNPDAARRAWTATRNFFEEVLGP